MSDLPEVVGEAELSNSFLGALVEVCLVTADHRRTMEGLVRLGIGPWRVYTFDADSVRDRTWHGGPGDWAITVCFAEAGGVVMEIMEPVHGPSVVQEHLDTRGEGIHHVAFDVENRPWQERIAAFAERGFEVSQSGVFAGGNAFAFFDTEAATGTTFETYAFTDDFAWPEPESWFPGPPPADAGNGSR